MFLNNFDAFKMINEIGLINDLSNSFIKSMIELNNFNGPVYFL